MQICMDILGNRTFLFMGAIIKANLENLVFFL